MPVCQLCPQTPVFASTSEKMLLLHLAVSSGSETAQRHLCCGYIHPVKALAFVTTFVFGKTFARGQFLRTAFCHQESPEECSSVCLVTSMI